MGNYMNKGNLRVGSAAGFKIEYLNKVNATSSSLENLVINHVSFENVVINHVSF